MPEKPKGEHVMLTYQWADQQIALKTYDFLVKNGLSVWMDIKAGIPSDNLYAGIAEAIEKSFVVVCFMSANYQESDFCKQELQYAKQRHIPIIPLKLQEGWEPTSWLGFITAGLVWLDFYHVKNFDSKATQLYNRIRSLMKDPPKSQSSTAPPIISIAQQNPIPSRVSNPRLPVSQSFQRHRKGNKYNFPTKSAPTLRAYQVSPISLSSDDSEDDHDKNDSKFSYG